MAQCWIILKLWQTKIILNVKLLYPICNQNNAKVKYTPPTNTKECEATQPTQPCSKMQTNKVRQLKYPSVINAKYLARNFPFKVSWWRCKTDLLERQLTRWSTKNKEYPKQAQQRTLKHHMSGRHKNITRNRTYLSASHKTQAVF